MLCVVVRSGRGNVTFSGLLFTVGSDCQYGCWNELGK